MKLSRIRIEQFRQFRRPIEIADLEPGLNLFTGANEAGKSTLVAAIRAAFFERHRSSSVDDLRPWDDPGATPTVEIEFNFDGCSYTLTKSFLGRKRCEVRCGDRRLDGAAAEDHLAELLGFQYAGRGASAPEHWGIPGLLWIRQGAAHEVRQAVQHATGHLRRALDQSLGEVASSGGDDLLARVEADRNELLTPSTGAPRGRLAEAIRAEAASKAAVDQLAEAVAVYRRQVDQLAALRREHADDEADRPWQSLREQQQAARERLDEIGRVEKALADDRRHADGLADRARLLGEQLAAFAAHEREAAERATGLAAARDALAAALAAVEPWRQRRADAVRAHDAAREALRLARQHDTRRTLQRQLDDLSAEAEGAGALLARAEAAQAALLGLQQRAAATEIAAADLAALRERQRELGELRLRRAAAATRLVFALDDGRQVDLGGEALAGHGERVLLENTVLTLPGLGRMEIAPGGSDLAALGQRERLLADDQAAQLQRLGLADVDAAEARQQAQQQLLADAKTAAATLKALAPKGLDALRTVQATRLARAAECRRALGELPRADEPAPTDGGHAASILPVAQAEATEETARVSVDRIDEGLHAAERTAVNAQAALDAAGREAARARVPIDAPDRAARLAATRQALVDTHAEQAVIGARIETRARQVADVRPDILRQDVERFGRSAEQHEKRFAERRDALLRLEVELEGAGAQGLDERHAELGRDLAAAERRSAELRRRAGALDHLWRLLRDKRQGLTRRLQAPLQKHLDRYLQLLFAQASLAVDEQLAPGTLTRPGAGEVGDFDALSFGAREQLGVLSRLAYADLLHEAGRPTLVILDDALVHSDAERLALMKRVLFDAAQRHQILLLTCHPLAWRDLGVGARSLERLKAGA